MKPYLLSSLLYLAGIGMVPALGAAESETAAPDAEASAVVAQPDVKHGAAIFATICSHCHHTDHTASAVGAPGLMDVLERHDEAWIDQWLQGPEAFSKRNEAARDLVASNPFGLIMPTLPEMQQERNRRDIIAYLKTLKSE